MAEMHRRIVWIACTDTEGQGVRWFGHLRTEEGAIEHGPEWVSPEEAMVWARERSSAIFVKLRVEGRYWWAGEGSRPPFGPPTEGSIAWLDAGLPMPADHLPRVQRSDPSPMRATVTTRAVDGTISIKEEPAAGTSATPRGSLPETSPSTTGSWWQVGSPQTEPESDQA